MLLLLMLLVLGIFEFGRAMYIKNTLTNAARAAARVAVVTYGIDNGSTNVNNSCTYGTAGNDLVFKAACSSLYQGARNNNVVINLTVPSTPAKAGDIITVKVEWRNFVTLVPIFIPALNNVTLKGETSMRYE